MRRPLTPTVGCLSRLLTKEDAIVSDSLNHASIIDGVRLCKAARYRYANNDMVELEERLKEARANGARNIIVVTDGVFSMDGYVAQIDKICDLADTYDAMVMVDECHATGFIGKTGRGSIEARNALGRVDIITGTLGKAMGGAMGGFTTGKREIIDMLRQRSRPYLFSNSLPRALSVPPSRCSRCWTKPRNCATPSERTPRTSRRACARPASRSKTENRPLCL